MPIAPFSSAQYEKRTQDGTTGDECCLCGRQTGGLEGAIHVPIDHCCGTFVNQDAVDADPEGLTISYYPIGPECARKWKKEFDARLARFNVEKTPEGEIQSCVFKETRK